MKDEGGLEEVGGKEGLVLKEGKIEDIAEMIVETE
jgi:hypothetical protein